ncbi:hypothetical protein KL930_001734 [Ogataea haglerorum]|nr:hypothetical protein KL948_002065 [Ogataea haglerorum]KAG7740170.1 hypothetical protein KL923_002011 [Ogataea haglerorum]KAG7775856.1 hypothetical protein KL922_003921 [Ogataea haglerorum]KAG7780812.1 hypothetical protein KL930_001734 [Ogataea haglerorum]
MSSGYVRGPQCGVDNCTSNLWKRIDGRNVCFYGHVNENDIEIDDEEDQLDRQTMGTYSRRLRNIAGLTNTAAKDLRSQQFLQEQQRDYAHGMELRKLLVQCLQIILMRQTETLEDKLKLPQGYQSVVKRYWAMYLLHKHTKKDSSAVLSQMADFSSVPTVSDLLVFCYLGLVRMRLPVYFSDLWGLACSGDLPYLRAENVVPLDLRLRVPVHALRVFHGAAGDKVDHFAKMKHTMHNLGIGGEFAPPIIWYPLLTKTVLQLRLPLETVEHVSDFIGLAKIDMSIDMRSAHHPELKLWALLIVTACGYFKTSATKYKVWKLLYESRAATKHNKTVMQNRIVNKSGFLDLVSWTDKQTAEYLDFFETSILPIISKENVVDDTNSKYHTQKMMTSRLFNIFDLPSRAETEEDPLAQLATDYRTYAESSGDDDYSETELIDILKAEMRAHYGLRSSVIDRVVDWALRMLDTLAVYQ